jgi:hypothetical protein
MVDSSFTGVCNSADCDPLVDFSAKHQEFLTHQEIVPSFKSLENYQDLGSFLQARFGNKAEEISKYVIDVSYEAANFDKLAAELTKYGILAVKNIEEQSLELTYDKYQVSASFAPVLKFSGKIHLTKPIEVAARLVIFEQADFIGENQKISITKAIENKNAYHVYIHDLSLNNLWLDRVDSLWMSGNVKINDINFNGVDFPFAHESMCQTNVAKQAKIEVSGKFSVKSNCLNVEGSLIANVIDINSIGKSGELYIANAANFIGTKELAVNSYNNFKVIQNGMMASAKLHIASNGEFYNKGIVILGNSYDGQPHEISIKGLFNQRDAKIESYNDVKISTYAQSGNLGLINIKHLDLVTPNKIQNQGMFYNNGFLSGEVINANSNSYILNDNSGTVISSNDINIIPYSIVNRNGNVINWKMDFDFDMNIDKAGNIQVVKQIKA